VLVGHQHHDEVGAFDGVADLGDLQPAFLTLSHDGPPLRTPTVTLTPESFRFCAWAWPCEP
jgi:hypothetical protein